MKATTLLRNQHREAKELLGQAVKATSASDRRKLAEKITQELELHTQIEEELFYPAVRDVNTKKSNQIVLESIEEHHVVDLVLEELPQLDPSDESFPAKMKVLRDLVEHHIQEEENEMFKQAEKLGSQRLDELGAEMEERVEELKQSS